MKPSLLVLLTLLALQLPAQTKIAGISFPATLKGGKTELVLNGGGVREKYFMDMYVAGLYLPEKSTDAKKIITADEPMAIRLHIVSGLITSDKMIEAVEQGFARSTGGDQKILQTRIDQFIDLYREQINKGDIFDLIYLPGKGTVIFKNGQMKATIPGLDFKAGMFGIWLCDQPADETLKNQLLGKIK